jgi:tetratricopeptide (TPR) repeat protein
MKPIKPFVWSLSRALILAMLTGFVLGCAGSSGSSTGPYSPQSAALRDPARASQLTQEALKVIDKDPVRAETLLREALTADLYHGPAHNDLGVLYLKRSPPMLYEAAGEFEWARKLIPGHPDPRVNLALTLEKAGRTDDALNAYETALEVYPHYLPAIQGLARLQLRTGKPDQRTNEFLQEIMMRGDTEQWRQWARRQQIAGEIPK